MPACIVVRNLRPVRTGELAELRTPLLDLERYCWRTESQSGCFVQRIEYEGPDLWLTLAPMRQIRRWADGALIWQVMAMLERFQRWSGAPVAPIRATPSRRPQWAPGSA